MRNSKNNRLLFFMAITASLLLGLIIGLSICYWPEIPYKKVENQESIHTLKVVGLFPMTGPGSSLGTFLNNGVTLAKESLEKKYEGKLNIELEIIDTKNQPKEAISGLRSTIARNRPHAVISGLSSVSSAVKPVIESEGIFTVATTTALNGLVQDTKYFVRIYPTASNFAKPISDYANMHFTKVGVLYVHDDFGESVYQSFAKILETGQVEIVSAQAYELLQKDTRTLIDRMLTDEPQAIYVIGYGPAYISVIKQLKELSPETIVLADIAFPNPAVLSALGNAAEGVVFDGTDAELTEPVTTAAAQFRNRYKERFNAEPFMVAGFAYDSLALIVNSAMTEDQFKLPAKTDAIRLSPLTGIMGKIQLDKDGDSDIDLVLMKRAQDKTVLLDE